MPRRTWQQTQDGAWSAPCPKCGVLTGQACRDLRSPTGLLYGTRTHRERRMAIRSDTVVKVTTEQLVGDRRLWDQWYPTTTTAATTTPQAWYHWGGWPTTTGTVTYTTTANATLVWENLQTDTWYRWQQAPQPTAWPPAHAIDPAVLQERREEAAARRLAQQRRMEGAEDRAMELLRSLLSADEVRHMVQHQEILVAGNDGGRYVIELGRVHGNIRQVDEHGCLLGRMCVQPGMYDYAEGAALPLADGYIGQYLGLKFNEAVVRAKANWSQRTECRRPELTVTARPILAA